MLLIQVFLSLTYLRTKPETKNEYLLYAPTFFPSSLQKTIPYLRTIDHFNVLIKLHHFFWTKKKYISHKSALENEN